MSSSPKERFDRAVGRHFDLLYRVAFHLTRNRPDAEDLVQEACLRAFDRLADVERADNPLAWLLRVQHRIFLDTTRRRRRSPLHSGQHEAAAAVATEASGPEELAADQQLRQLLAAAWLHLNVEQRALLALHNEGLSLAALEAVTGISSNAIGVRLHRARRRLAKLLESHLEPTMGAAPTESVQ